MTTTGAGPGATRYARNGSVDIAFEDLGGAGGDPLLLVMGLGVSRFWWPQGLVVRQLTLGDQHVHARRIAGIERRLDQLQIAPVLDQEVIDGADLLSCAGDADDGADHIAA